MLHTVIIHSAHDTINTIGKHVHQQANSHDPEPWKKQRHHIQPAGPITMQRMKADTAPAWVEQRAGQEVIKVYRHSSDKYKIYPQPPLPEKTKGYDTRQDKMQ